MTSKPSSPHLAAVVFAGLLLPAASALAQTDAVDDSYSVDDGGSLAIAAPGVMDNDCCPSRDPITVTAVEGSAAAVGIQITLPSGSLLTLSADGSFSYDHNLGSGADSFTYQITDTQGVSDTATVSISVLTASIEAGDDSYEVASGGTLAVPAPGVLGNDTDPEGDVLSVGTVEGSADNVGVELTLASGSSLTVQADGSFTYVHSGTVQEDAFTYQATDGASFSNTATVTITVSTGGTGTATVEVTFTDLEGVATRTRLRKGVLERLFLVAPLATPATVSGTAGLPTSSNSLVVDAKEATVAELARELFLGCEKKALVAQARAEKYGLLVRFELDDATDADGDSEQIRIRLSDAEMECLLLKPSAAPPPPPPPPPPPDDDGRSRTFRGGR